MFTLRSRPIEAIEIKWALELATQKMCLAHSSTALDDITNISAYVTGTSRPPHDKRFLNSQAYQSSYVSISKQPRPHLNLPIMTEKHGQHAESADDMVAETDTDSQDLPSPRARLSLLPAWYQCKWAQGICALLWGFTSEAHTLFFLGSLTRPRHLNYLGI